MDPTQMSDDELKKAIDTGQEPEPKAEEPEVLEVPKDESPAEETPEEKPQAEQPEETVEEPSEEQAPPISRRKAERLNKLESLVERLRGEQVPKAPKVEGLDYRTALDTDEEVVKTLETDRESYGQQQYNAGLEQARSLQFHTRLEIDAPIVSTKYGIFNKESEEYNPAAAKAIDQWYLATVGYNPETDTVANGGVRYAQFVEGIMELANEMAGTKVEKTQTNIAKQAANTGLRPDGSTSKRLNLNKTPEEMTVEELNAVINQSLPKR